MADLKQKRNSFEFKGKAIITDKTFTIDKLNDAKTWQYNSLNLGVDCGNDGIHYVSLMGGFNPNKENYIYLNTIDEDGKFSGQKLNVAWEDRFNITPNMSQLNMIKIALNTETNYSKEIFMHPYDAIKAIKAYLENDMLISVTGHIDFTPETDTSGNTTWRMQHIVDGIFARRAEGFVPSTSLKFSGLIDKDTIGKPNKEDKNIPLFIKIPYYVNKVNKVKYNQTCLVPIKVLWNIAQYGDKIELVKSAKEQIFTPEDKKYADEIGIKCRYTGGVKTVEPSIEDLPQQLQTLIALGVLTKEQALSGDAIKNTVPSELEFVTINTIGGETPNDRKPDIERKKYLLTEYKFFEDLEPIESTNVTTSTTNTADSTVINSSEDFASNGDIDDLFKLFAE